MSVPELEAAIIGLSADELAYFSRWFEEYMADQWDCQIETDISTGRFDAAGQRAVAEFEEGRCQPL